MRASNQILRNPRADAHDKAHAGAPRIGSEPFVQPVPEEATDDDARNHVQAHDAGAPQRVEQALLVLF